MQDSCPGGDYRRSICYLLLLTLLSSAPVFAEAEAPAAQEEGAPTAGNVTPAPAPTAPASIVELPPLVVTEQPAAKASGSSSLTQQTIRALPTLNPNVTDLAPLLPGVQASDDASLATRGGEILPALISISGGKADQNNLVIDGVGSSSLIDPLASNPEDPQNVPSHPQGLFPNVRLVEDITVLDHNIPARYGNFTGGVLEIHTRDPKPTYAAGVNLRTTRSGWTWFHLNQDERDYLENKATITQHPQFKFIRYDGGLDIDLPVGQNSAFLGSYQRSQSDLTYPFLRGEKSQQRILENYLAKSLHDFGRWGSLELSLLATPYVAQHFLEETKDSDYTIHNRNFTGKAAWNTSFDGNKFGFSLAYASIHLSRNAPKDFWQWANTPSKSWGTGTSSQEGGYGSLDRTQEMVRLQSHQTFAPIDSGWLRQVVESGVGFGWVTGTSARAAATYSYALATTAAQPPPKTGAPPIAAPPADCGGDPYCVANEQYLRSIRIYDPYRIEVDRAEIAAYLQDNFVLGPLQLRPGLRFDYDTLSENQNLAPRFSSAYDLFGTELVFGANRYYSMLAFTDALREKEPAIRVLKRDSFELPWIETVATSSNRRTDLKTPYVDELSAGVEQPLWGGDIALDYVHRKGKDEIARQIDLIKIGSTTYTTSRFNNNGRSHYESYRLAWLKKWQTREVLANVSREEVNTSVEKYDDLLTEQTRNRLVYYNGNLLYRDELPRNDYNRTWRGNFILRQQLPLGCEFTNVTRYRGTYHALKLVKANQSIDGQLVDVYADVKSPAGWTFDWKLAWRQAVGSGEVLLSLDVLNIFNHSNRVGGEEGLYETGRQIWAGVEGRF